MLSNRIKKLKIIFYLAFPVVLWLLPADFFDHGPELCLSQFLLHTKCYGCGVSRAMMHLLHGDIYGALAYNKLCLIVLPLLIMIWLQDLRKDVRYLRALKTTKAANI